MINLNKNVLAVIAQVATLKGNRFASLLYTSKESGEVARHTILIGFDYHNAVETSAQLLHMISWHDMGVKEKAQFDYPTFLKAKAEVFSSLRATLAAHAVNAQNPAYTKKDTYEMVSYEGQQLNGIRFNPNDGSFKLFGLTQSKVVLKNGVFKQVKSAPKTLAKKAITDALPVGKFREYAIEPNALEVAKINGNTIEL